MGNSLILGVLLFVSILLIIFIIFKNDLHPPSNNFIITHVEEHENYSKYRICAPICCGCFHFTDSVGKYRLKDTLKFVKNKNE